MSTQFQNANKIKFMPLPYIGMFDLDVIYQTSDAELLYQVLYKLNEIAKSQNIIIDNFQKVIEWATEQIEKFTKEQLEEWLEDGTLINMLLALGNIVKYFETTEELLESHNLVDGQTVITLGYSQVNDGGNALIHITSVVNPDKFQFQLNDGLYGTVIEWNKLLSFGIADNESIDNIVRFLGNEIDLKGGTYQLSTTLKVSKVCNGGLIVNNYNIANIKYINDIIFYPADNSTVNIVTVNTPTSFRYWNFRLYGINDYPNITGLNLTSSIYLSNIDIFSQDITSVVNIEGVVTSVNLSIDCQSIKGTTIKIIDNPANIYDNTIKLKETCGVVKTCIDKLIASNTYTLEIYNDSGNNESVTPFVLGKTRPYYPGTLSSCYIESCGMIDDFIKVFTNYILINCMFTQVNGVTGNNLNIGNNNFNVNTLLTPTRLYNVSLINGAYVGTPPSSGLDYEFTFNNPVAIIVNSKYQGVSSFNYRPVISIYDGKHVTGSDEPNGVLINSYQTYSTNFILIIDNPVYLNRLLTISIVEFNYVNNVSIINLIDFSDYKYLPVMNGRVLSGK